MSKGDLVSVLEINDTHIKLLQAQGPVGARTLVYADIQKIEQFTDEALEKLLTRMQAACSINNDLLTLLIPRRVVILKQLSLPSQSEEEIRRMLNLQIVNYMPYTRDDVVFDFCVVEKEVNGYAKILVAIVHREIVLRYLRIMQKIQLNPHRVGVSSFGLQAWFNLQHDQVDLVSAAPTMFIDIDQTQSEICFFYKGKMLFSRSIRYGARDLNAEQIDDFFEQIGLTLGTYKKGQWGPEIKMILMAPALPEGEGLKSKMEEYFGLPVAEQTPFAEGLDEGLLKKEPGVSTTAALGFLLGKDEVAIELMPQEIKTIKLSRVFRLVVLQFLLLLGLSVLLTGAALGLGLYHELAQLRRIQRDLARTNPLAQQAENRMALIDMIKGKVQNQVLIADVLNDLIRLTPADVTFNSIYFDQLQTLTIQGSAPSGTGVNAFQNNLVNSAKFSDVNLEYATKRRRFDSEFTEFKIVCKIHPQEASAR